MLFRLKFGRFFHSVSLISLTHILLSHLEVYSFMKNQWNKIIIICEDSNDVKIIVNDKIHKSKLRPQYKLKEHNSLRRALNCFGNIFFDCDSKEPKASLLKELNYLKMIIIYLIFIMYKIQ